MEINETENKLRKKANKYSYKLTEIHGNHAYHNELEVRNCHSWLRSSADWSQSTTQINSNSITLDRTI